MLLRLFFGYKLLLRSNENRFSLSGHSGRFVIRNSHPVHDSNAMNMFNEERYESKREKREDSKMVAKE